MHVERVHDDAQPLARLLAENGQVVVGVQVERVVGARAALRPARLHPDRAVAVAVVDLRPLRRDRDPGGEEEALRDGEAEREGVRAVDLELVRLVRAQRAVGVAQERGDVVERRDVRVELVVAGDVEALVVALGLGVDEGREQLPVVGLGVLQRQLDGAVVALGRLYGSAEGASLGLPITYPVSSCDRTGSVKMPKSSITRLSERST
jgi:hypothetical protein